MHFISITNLVHCAKMLASLKNFNFIFLYFDMHFSFFQQSRLIQIVLPSKNWTNNWVELKNIWELLRNLKNWKSSRNKKSKHHQLKIRLHNSTPKLQSKMVKIWHGTVCIRDLDKFNLIWRFNFMRRPIFATALDASKNTAPFHISDHQWPKNNQLASSI